MAGESIAAILAEAKQLLAQKKYDEAIDRLLAVLQQEPEDADTLSLLGAAHAENRDYPQAVAYFDKSLRIQPSARGHFNLASLYRMQGENTKAISSLREALKLDANYSRAQQMLGELGVKEETAEETPVQTATLSSSAQTTPNQTSQFGNLPPPPTQTPAYGSQTPMGQAQGKPAGPPSQFAPATRTQTVVVKNWPKIIGGGIMVGIPYLLMSLWWACVLLSTTGFAAGLIIGLLVMGAFFKWLSNSAGAFETQHWILMILLTGLLPSLLVIKGFDLIAAGWYHTEQRSF